MDTDRWQRLEAAFLAVADLPPGPDREARVTALCEGDAALAAEVAALLDEEERLSDADASRDPHLGLRLGAYEVVRLVARGGMATVYEGRRADGAFDQRVAIKIMDVRLHDEALLAQFKAERQILAALEHPGLTRLFDGGLTGLGEPYLVMEFVDGQPIDRHCDTHRLALADRVALMRAVCDGVSFAHRALVLHRDLKPSNILVTTDGHVKVVDFGTATLLQPERLATTSAAPLTPAYASPEQLTGRPVGTASDQYSLGLVLFELLTGAPPFGDRPSLLAAIERAMAGTTTMSPSAAVTEAAATARQSSVTRLRRVLSQDLGTIVGKAAAPDPAARYASVQHFADDLARWSRGEPIDARPPSIAYRTTRFVQRHWAASLVAATLSVGLAVATIVSVRSATEARAQAMRADAQNRRATEVTRFLTRMLSSADPGELGKDVTVREVLQRASADAASLDATPELAAEVRSVMGQTFRSLGDFAAGEEQARLAVAANRRATPAGNEETVRLLTLLSHLQESAGHLDDATRSLDEAGALLPRLPGASASLRFEYLSERGRVLVSQGAFRDALQVDEDALRLARATPLAAEARTRAAADLALVLTNLGRHAEAVALYTESVEQARLAFGPRSVQVADRLSPYASALWYAGERERALGVYQKALDLRRETQGPEHPDYAFTLANYADSLVWFGQYERAAAMAREILALRGKTLDDAHPMVAFSMSLLGRCLGPLGQLAEAERWLRDSYALRQRTLPKGHWLLASSRSTLAAHLVLAKRFSEAEALLLPAERELTAALGDDAPTVADARRRLVDLYTAWQRPSDATMWQAKLPEPTATR
ncbi:MAG: serine/threonine-protein kinase [Vicinamibacterales bacterium]